MKCWVARSASKTHVRIQLEPFPFDWPGWDIREGQISAADYRALCSFPIDDVDLERIHQEVWLDAVQNGQPATFQAGPAVREQRDLV